jgi:hypothetical protein
MGEPPIIPSVRLPEAVPLPPRMTLPVPSAEMPRYQPLVLPSAEQVRQMQASEEEDDSEEKGSKPKEPEPQQQMKTPVQLPAVNIPEVVSQPEETTKVTLPGTDIQLTVPKEEVLTTAAATAGVAALASVAATMAAGPLVQRLTKILKPVMKTALKKLATVKGVQSATLYESDARRRWRQRVRTRRTMGDRV